MEGRATVVLTFQRPGPATILKRSTKRKVSNSIDFVLDNFERYSEQEEREEVRLVVDGINYPYTAGNFIDLCLKDFYDNIPVKQDFFDEFDGLLQRQNSSKSRRMIIGDYREGYIDPLTNRKRTIPLEVLRSTSSGLQYTVTGGARN